MTEAVTTVDELVELLRRLATVDTEGAGFSELEHGLQCAAILEAEKPDDVELQVAGLVHDVGHQFGDDAGHGDAGAAAVRGLLGDRVADLVAEHIPAKRYLVATDPSYRELLSPASVLTLAAQGGASDARPSDGALTLRRADDRAKEPGRLVPGLDHWVPMIRKVGWTHGLSGRERS
jgi:predicted HD phosphohydrolase